MTAPVAPWIAKHLTQIQRIARRHDIHCPLRIAMITGRSELVCNCRGKRRDRPPKEKVLSDVLNQIGWVTALEKKP